jgi:hypothetical protein
MSIASDLADGLAAKNASRIGQPTQLDASASFANGCVSGVLQFRFWIDDGNGVVGDAGDALLRTWTEDPILLDAPDVTTRYGVEARCSLMATCADSTTALVSVPCPGTAVAPFGQSIGFTTRSRLAWTTPTLVDVLRGNLNALRSSDGQFNGTVIRCVANDVLTNSITDFGPPAAGNGFYFLVRSVGPSPFCDTERSWTTGTAAEAPGAGGDRDADIVLDPDACP